MTYCRNFQVNLFYLLRCIGKIISKHVMTYYEKQTGYVKSGCHGKLRQGGVVWKISVDLQNLV